MTSPLFGAGDTVDHSTLGRGKVIEIKYTGENQRGVIDFDVTGRKELLLIFVGDRLRKVSP